MCESIASMKYICYLIVFMLKVCLRAHFFCQETLIISNLSQCCYVGWRNINLCWLKDNKKLKVRYTTCTHHLGRILFHATEWYPTEKSSQQPLKRSHLTTLNLKVHLQSNFNINYWGKGPIVSKWPLSM